MKNTLFLLAVSSLALSACGLVEVEYDKLPKDSAAEIIEDVPVRETKNVTYTGVVAPAGISVYNQGTHRLVLPGGKFILLEANDIDLNGYVDEEVQIFGSLRPTVEAGGMIMRVERIELIEKEEEVNEPVEEELPVNPDDTDDVPFEEPEEEPREEQSSDADLEPVELPANEEVIEEIEESEVIEEAEEVSSVPSAEFKALIEVMSRQDYAAANWTQQYCTSHISFCAPVHRNWWFKSFGATSSTLWHVELSPEPIESLGQGPLVIELIAGSNTDADGTIDVSNGKAVGYKEWTFGRHFRISGDESLKDAILYITQNITDYAS
ncbi:MAG: hypothetical protein O3A81_02990 [bacterium]|nr:hypothetical protein [bacterium]